MKKTGKRLALLFGAISLILLFSFSAFAASNPIKNGYYMIQSGNATNRVLDINNYSMNNGGNLEIYQKNGTSNQVFYLQYRNNGYYSIQAVHSGYYLHKANSGKTDDVHQWSGYGANNTQWALESAGNGYYYIRSRSGNYLDNSGARTTLGNNVGTYKKNNSAAQKWKFIAINRPNYSVKMSNISKLSGSYDKNSSKTISGRITANYPVTKLEVIVYNTSGKNMNMTGSCIPKSREFSFNHTFKFSSLAAGNYYYRIKVWNVQGDSAVSGKYNFSIKDNTPKVNPSYSRPANGTYYLTTAIDNNYVIDVYGKKSKDGTNVQLYINKRGSNQKFQVTHVTDGWYKIIDSNSKKSLDVSGGVARSGVNVQLYYWNGSAAQLWRFYDAGGGYYYIQNKLGYYLDVSGGTARNETNIQVYTWNKTNAQKWYLYTDQKENERLQKLINNASSSYISSENSFNKYGKQVVTNIESSYNGVKNTKKEKISSGIHKMIASNLPANVEKAFTNELFNNVDKQLTSKPSSYDKVKTSVDLVKKVANDTPNGTTKISFKVGNQTWIAEITYQSVWGNTVYFLTFNNTYKGIGVSLNEGNISAEMNFLKQFAQSKIDEAKKALFKDASGILIPSDVRSFLKTTTKSAIYSEIKKFSPKLEAQIKAADTMASKYIDLKNAYIGLKSINISNSTDAEKVANTVLNYNKKIQAYESAVTAFTNIR